MDRAAWVDIHPISSVQNGNGPLEFLIAGSQDEYLDLNDTGLYVKMRVVKSNGSDITTAEATAGKICTANLTLAALFSDVSVTMNDTLVEGGHYLYPYKAMMSCLLQFDNGMKKTQLLASGYQEDKDERINWSAESKMKEFMGPLFLDVFSQSKYLLPGVDVKVRLTRSKPEFIISNDGKGGVKILLEEAILYVRRVKVTPAVLAAHELGLKSSNVIYPIQQSEMTCFTISKGSKSHTQEHLFRGQLPKLLIMGMVSNDAFNGNLKKDPLTFDHFNINFLALHREGECVPFARPLQPDFENGLVVREYMQMIQCLEMFHRNENNGITLKDFAEGGKTLFVFNLTPDLNAANGGCCGQPYKTGNLRMELHFAKALVEPINVILFALCDGKLEITKARQIVK
jgi:hypothetical protein